MPEEPTKTDSGTTGAQATDSGATQSSGETVIRVGLPNASPQGNQAGGPNQVEVLEKRIRDTEEALKTKQAELHDVASRAALEKRLAETEGQLKSLLVTLAEPDSQEGKEEQDWAEKVNWDDAITQKPGETLKDVVVRLRSDFAKVLEERDKSWDDKMQKVVATATNPDRQKYVNVIQAFATKVPGFTQLSGDVQISIAKAMEELASGTASTPEPEPRTATPLSPVGTGVSPIPKRSDAADRKQKARDLARAMGFSSLDSGVTIRPVLHI